MPDALHSRSCLEKVRDVVLTLESSREILVLNQVVRHAPCDINGEDDRPIELPSGQLLNQLNDVRDQGRNVVNACRYYGTHHPTVP